MRRGSNLVRLGDFNQTVVLDVVRRHPHGVSRAELGQLTGLTPQTVSNIARRLLDAGLLREGSPTPPTDGRRGKPRTPLFVEAGGGYALGVHVDPARLTFVLVDLAGEVLVFSRLPTPNPRGGRFPARVITLIATTVAGLVQRAGIDPGRVLGLGVAAPGPIDVEGGVLIDPPQLAGWSNVRLRTDLREATGLPVLLDKDVTAAATAELRAADTTPSNFVFLYLGSGVGAGIVLGDEVQRGATNNIGEIGELLVDPDPDAQPLGWGRPGSLATYCIPQAMVERADRAGVLRAPAHGDFVAQDAAFSTLCELAYAGDPAAAQVIDRSATAVATGLASLVNLLDVDRVVLGGPLWSRLSSRYLALLPRLITRDLIVPGPVVGRRPLVVDGSAVGEDVAAQGAAALVLDHFLAPKPSTLLMEQVH